MFRGWDIVEWTVAIVIAVLLACMLGFFVCTSPPLECEAMFKYDESYVIRCNRLPN